MDLLTRTTKALWDNLGDIVLLAGWAGSTAVFAWAVHSSGQFAEYRPLSSILSVFVGAGLTALIWRMGVGAHHQMVRNRYDAKLLAQGGAIDPRAKTFESKRIYLNEFAQPSNPLVDGKTFIDCEIIGPANIVLISGNSVTDQRLPVCDALVIAEGADPANGYAFRNCTFRGCSFVRITLMVTHMEYQTAKGVDWLRWISLRPDSDDELLLDSGSAIGVLRLEGEDS